MEQGQEEKYLNFSQPGRQPQDKSSAWTLLSERMLCAAKQELFLAMRYLFLPLNSLQYQKDQRIEWVATDGSRIYYNPIKLIQTYQENPINVNRAYLHMVFHCLFRNLYAVKDRDRQAWDLACDIMAEYLIDGLELSCVMRPENFERSRIYKQLEEQCSVMSAPNIYYALLTGCGISVETITARRLFFVDSHDCWYAHNKEEQESGEQEDNRKSSGESSWEEAAKRTYTALTAFSQGRGDGKGKLKKVLGGSIHPKASYRDFLRKFVTVKETMHLDTDSFDYGFYYYGMCLYGNMPLIEELEYQEEEGIEDFVIVLDTSGSCAYALIQKFLDATFDILSEEGSFFENMNLHILQCDNQVQEDIVLHAAEDVEAFKEHFTVKGFGGTDFRPAFHYINEQRRKGLLDRLRGVLYFTDGYGIYPDEKPEYEVAFVFMGGFDEDRKVPGWALRLDIDEDALLL